MGMKAARSKAIEALRDGTYQAEQRKDLKEKNLLIAQVVTADEVIEVLKKAQGGNYRSTIHKDDPSVTIHIFEPKSNGVDWHIKFYFLEPDCYFISVHHSTKVRTTTKKR